MNTINFARSLPLDFAQFSILTPFPGTPLYEELRADGQIPYGETPEEIMENWLRYIPYPSFTGMKPIWTTPGRTFEDLNYCQKIALRKFYMRPRFVWERLKMLNRRNILPVTRLALGLFRK
jgi:magnesium-protoporphyrin IX monomethyl ester (oxidative) cyclase